MQIHGSYEEKFNRVKMEVVGTIQQHAPYLHTEDDNEEIWIALAPSVEQNRGDEEQVEINTILDTDTLTDEQRYFNHADQPE